MNEVELNSEEGAPVQETVEQPSGPRNLSQERAMDRIGQKAERRAERKLPVSGSEVVTED